MIEFAVVVGLVAVAPLALGRPARWALAGAAASAGLALTPGPAAALLGLPAVAVASLAVAERLGVRIRTLRELARLAVPAYAVVGAASLVASLAGLELFGLGEPIVRLTAVHYLYAGVGALTIARRADRPGLGTVAIAATAAAPPIVAAGFVTGWALPQVGGAVLMTVGVWATALLLLVPGPAAAPVGRRLLRIVAGASPWLPMVLAIGWALAQHAPGVPALSIPDMVRAHGLVNGLGFVLVGLVATRPPARAAAAQMRLRSTATTRPRISMPSEKTIGG